MEEQIHSALEGNEFEVYYQPQVDVLSDRIIGAEGIEKEARLSFLKQHRCDCARGYLFGKPEAAEEFLSHRHRDFIEITNRKMHRANA